MPQHRNDEPNDQPSDDLRARVSDLALRVENGFNRVDAELWGLRQEMNQRLEAQDRTMNQRFEAQDRKIDAGFDRLQSTINRFGGGLLLTMLALFGTAVIAI